MSFVNSILEIILFFLAIVFCFYLPGKFLISRLKIVLSFHEDVFFSFGIGIVIFTLISYIFSWLRLEIGVLFFFFIVDIISIKNNAFHLNSIEKKHRKSLSLVLFLSFIFSLPIILSGQIGNSILYQKDDLWHLALINELRENFPPGNPGFSEIPLKGYHFFYNFLLAKISNIFHISTLSIHFHFFPIFLAIIWGLGVYALIYKWSKSRLAALWAVFLTMFGGSFAFILLLEGHTGLSLNSAFGIQQPAPSMENPPFSISIVIILVFLFAAFNYFVTKQKKWIVSLVLCVGMVSMFKVYAGIILIPIFCLLAGLEIIRKRFVLPVGLSIAGILFIGTYWIFADHSSRLIFDPLWAPHSVLIDNMPWYGYVEKMYTYTKLSVIKGIVETELYSWYVFIFGNLGTRAIGLLLLLVVFLKKRKTPSFFALIILIMILVSILIPLFFIQSGKVFEIIQIAWYFLFFSSLLAAFGFSFIFEVRYSNLLKILLLIVIVILTIPSSIENYQSFLKRFSHSSESIYNSDIEAMIFLKSKGSYNDTVLEIPPQYVNPTEEDVARWYKEVSTPKITAFSNKRSYLSNENISFPGADINKRIPFVVKLIAYNKTIRGTAEYINLQNDIRTGLLENKISFIYSPYSIKNINEIKNIHQEYKNKAATVYSFY